ncbi:5-methylcytosine restriction system specificity protein McrC [Aestuariimicrobium sp. Y1814]|uniref:5-methylcytosine restriction system specificity protein McrC n=1 Tax=Aestuariimicrobium sp. Y1814 TaxID=3418742 RepID=UPI003DA70742
MLRRIPVTEYVPVEDVSSDDIRLIRARLAELAVELRPRRKFVAPGSDLVIRNLVGTVQVNRDLVLDIAPDVSEGVDWAGALVDLLSPPTRIGFGGENRESERRPVRVLPDAFAELYLRQLDGALRKDGPLTLIQSQYASVPSLAGRLDVTRWVTQRTLKPADFPQHRSALTVDNPFTAMLAAVAQLLASSTSDPRVASALHGASGRLRPGLAPHVALDPSAALRELPPQWRAYGPAWATARSVVRRVAPLRRHGHLEGLGVALEPWPLLETLLERSLKAVGEVAARQGHAGLSGLGHTGTYPLRTPTGDTAPGTERFHVKGDVDPDGLLRRGSDVVATFEAKYTTPTTERIRTHAFQALTTAAALRSPIAVLVYPTNFEPIIWELTGFTTHPQRLIAVGLDMYRYRSGVGDASRAERLYRGIEAALPAASAAAAVAS